MAYGRSRKSYGEVSKLAKIEPSYFKKSTKSSGGNAKSEKTAKTAARRRAKTVRTAKVIKPMVAKRRRR